MTTAPKHRWFRNVLWATIAVALGGAAFVTVRLVAIDRAQHESDRAIAAWESGLATPREVCEASRRRMLAETALPWADRRGPTTAHLERVDSIWTITYGPASEWLMGVDGDAALADAKATRAEVERYYQEAKRLAAEANGRGFARQMHLTRPLVHGSVKMAL